MKYNNLGAPAGKEEALVVEVLRYLKERNISKKMVQRLSKKLSRSTKKDLEKNLRLAPDWMVSLLKDSYRTDEERSFP